MRKFLFATLSIAIIGASFPLPAVAAVKAGSPCPKIGKTSASSGKTFTCVKVGKNKVWNKGSVFSKKANQQKPNKPAPSSTTNDVQTIVYSQPSQPSSNIDSCKVQEKSTTRGLYDNSLPTGFPTSKYSFATKTGTVKWALVPIDFSDIPGESNFRSRVDGQMKLLSEWFDTVSEGKFKVEWVVADKWTTLPGKSTDYTIPFSDGPDRSPAIADFWTKAIRETDKNFDYSNVQTVNFILPLKQTVVAETLQGFPWEQAVKNYVTQEGKISSFSIAGVFMNQLNRQYWSYWAHEFGHAMGIPHVGSSRIANPYLSLDLMGAQDGYTRELSGWLRFLAGWLDEEKIYCQELSKLASTELTLVPLSGTSPGLKMAVVPVSESKALIIESRRETKFSCTMPTKKNGVLMYLYDATLGHGENFLIPLTPSGRTEEASSDCAVNQYPDPLLHKGEKLTAEGITVEVLESANYDRIRIQKAG
jgi:M6 family metalloprotease-like protein